MHYEQVLDVGYDYGASGGLGWNTEVISYPNGRTRRNENWSRPLGSWQLGNRTIDGAMAAYLQDFFHAMRGKAHSFLYKDWNDYAAVNEQLVIDGSDEAQLIKTYGLGINPWVREIVKPKADTVVLEIYAGTWQTISSNDYELDAATGIVTFDSAPDTGAQIRWSGEFYVPVRFDRDGIDVQFLGIDKDTRLHAYDLGALSVVEEPEI